MKVYQDKRLTIFQSALYQTNTTLYIAESFILLVDPNWLPQEVETIKQEVDLIKGDKPVYLLFTHSDYDHIIAFGLFPNAKVIASQAFQENINKEKIIEEIHQFDQQHYLKRDYPISYPEVDIVVSKDGQEVLIGEERFIFYLSPGHTNDGIFTIIASQRILIAGDYLSDLEFPFICYSAEAYLKTLEKVDLILQNHIIQILIPGHGQYLKDNVKDILFRKQRDEKYILDLKKSLLNNSRFPLEHWLSQFPFPKGLIDQHEKNKKQMAKDL